MHRARSPSKSQWGEEHHTELTRERKRRVCWPRTGAWASVAVCQFTVLAYFPVCGLGEIITVPGNYPTIQEGLNAAVDGDEVVVSPGIYFENVRFFGRDITLRSVDPLDPAVVESTVIDGQATHSVVVMDRGTISGFTLRNGDAGPPDWDGGGIMLRYAADREAEISYNVITDCVGGAGGGIRATEGVVHHNTVTGNRASFGGGIEIAGGEVFNNVVTMNEVCCYPTGGWGGGIAAFWDARIRDNVIFDNYADGAGGGLWVEDNVLVENNVILDNQAVIEDGGGVVASGQGVVVRDNLISGNSLLAGFSGGGGGVRLYCGLVENNVIIGNYGGDYGRAGGILVSCRGTVRNNLIAGNSVGQPQGSVGGVSVSGGSTLVGNTIVGNSGLDSQDVAGVSAGNDGTTVMGNIISFNDLGKGLFIVLDHAVIADYNCVFGHQDGDYGGQDDLGEHDVNVDPLFVDPLGADGIPWTEDDDLRLQPDSPCINAGDPDYVPADGETDLDAHARILCERVDIGAYEFGIGDFDCDRIVDLFDFVEWEACLTGPGGGPCAEGCEAFDFDGDLDVDFTDFGHMQQVFTGP